MSINVLYANISGISVQFLFIDDHENKRCTELLQALRSKTSVLCAFDHFSSQIMIEFYPVTLH